MKKQPDSQLFERPKSSYDATIATKDFPIDIYIQQKISIYPHLKVFYLFFSQGPFVTAVLSVVEKNEWPFVSGIKMLWFPAYITGKRAGDTLTTSDEEGALMSSCWHKGRLRDINLVKAVSVTQAILWLR